MLFRSCSQKNSFLEFVVWRLNLRSHTIKCFGLGIGLHSSFSNNRYYLPIYALFRCNLLSNKSLLFVDFRAGYSTNQMYKGENQGGFFGSAGLGMNLSVSKKFGSHILIGYNFYQISPFTDEKGTFQDKIGRASCRERV